MPSKTRSSKVKKAHSKSTIPKRKMRTRGRIVSHKGLKKKLLAFGNNSISEYTSPPKYSSELTSEEERASERKALISAIRYHQRQQEKNPAHLWKMRKRDVFNFNE